MGTVMIRGVGRHLRPNKLKANKNLKGHATLRVDYAVQSCVTLQCTTELWGPCLLVGIRVRIILVCSCNKVNGTCIRTPAVIYGDGVFPGEYIGVALMM